MSLILILAFPDMGYSEGTVASISNTMGFFAILTMLTLMSSVQNNFMPLIAGRPVYLREIASGLYSPSAYFIGMHYDLPLHVLENLIMISLTYYAVGLAHIASRFF